MNIVCPLGVLLILKLRHGKPHFQTGEANTIGVLFICKLFEVANPKSLNFLEKNLDFLRKGLGFPKKRLGFPKEKFGFPEEKLRSPKEKLGFP